uniref:Uncharacterized protein n=1 Tax=Daphnia galeata TaxID=27404 RepID=A0A8J2S447_9CRUS|nr:unnamed protein product [Daphnia galeata]
MNITIRSKDKIKRMKLKSYFIGVGGTEQRTVGKVMHKLVKYSLASQFCFKGQNDEKRCFENTEKAYKLHLVCVLANTKLIAKLQDS